MLWMIVHDQCVPHEQLNDDPAPCALVDLSGGEDKE
jgi:CDP-diacylglycerol pyrophosphatase